MDFTKDYLERLISDQVEESGVLEYKAAQALGRTNDRKSDITKDVSAFANAAGGVLIYGIRQHKDADRSHLPAALDPLNQSHFSKEWLDQIISLIQPRIDGLRIVPIHIGPSISDYCYVVEIPQGGTAHQAMDHRYYKRRNFESTSMEDYEIRDVMNRRKHPVVTATIRIISDSVRDGLRIVIRVENTGKVMAHYFSVVIHMPLRISSGLIHPQDATLETKDGLSLWLFSLGNDVGAPLFPGSMKILRKDFDYVDMDPEPSATIPEIRLTLYADDMEKINLTKDLERAEHEWT